MIKTKTVQFEKEVVESVACDKCKQIFEYGKDGTTEMEIQEFLHIRITGGYSSVFGDEEHVNLDICQHCLKKMLENEGIKWEQDIG